MSSWVLEGFLLFFWFILFLEVLRGRRALLYPNLWKPVPLMTMLITNGSRGQPSKLLVAIRQAHVKGRAISVTLAPTQNNLISDYQLEEQNPEIQTSPKAEIFAINRIIIFVTTDMISNLHEKIFLCKRVLSPGLLVS